MLTPRVYVKLGKGLCKVYVKTGRVYVKLRIMMLHTKYRSFGSCGSREENFNIFPIISLWQINTPPGRAMYMYEPQGHGWQDF